MKMPMMTMTTPLERRVDKILADLDNACRDLEDLRLRRRGKVTIAVLPSTASTFDATAASSLSVAAASRTKSRAHHQSICRDQLRSSR